MIVEQIKNISSGKKELRRFGITVSIALMVWAALFLWRGRSYYSCFFILSVIFLFFGTVFPMLLRPIHKLWMSLVLLLNWLISGIVLIILFYFVFTPIGLLGRLFGEKFLDLKFNKNTRSYWITKKPTNFKNKSYENQF